MFNIWDINNNSPSSLHRCLWPTPTCTRPHCRRCGSGWPRPCSRACPDPGSWWRQSLTEPRGPPGSTRSLASARDTRPCLPQRTVWRAWPRSWGHWPWRPLSWPPAASPWCCGPWDPVVLGHTHHCLLWPESPVMRPATTKSETRFLLGSNKKQEIFSKTILNINTSMAGKQFCLTKDDFRSSVSDTFKSLRENQELCDVTLHC